MPFVAFLRPTKTDAAYSRIPSYRGIDLSLLEALSVCRNKGARFKSVPFDRGANLTI